MANGKYFDKVGMMEAVQDVIAKYGYPPEVSEGVLLFVAGVSAGRRAFHSPPSDMEFMSPLFAGYEVGKASARPPRPLSRR